MSDNPNAWTPIHHFEPDDPDAEPEKPEGQAKPPTAEEHRLRHGPDPGMTHQPVGLMLTLPEDFVSAAWGIGDQVLRLAMAVEENTKAVLKLIEQRSGGETGI